MNIDISNAHCGPRIQFLDHAWLRVAHVNLRLLALRIVALRLSLSVPSCLRQPAVVLFRRTFQSLGGRARTRIRIRAYERARTRRTSDCWTLVGVRRGRAETVRNSYSCSIRCIAFTGDTHTDNKTTSCLSLSLLAFDNPPSFYVRRTFQSLGWEEQEEGYE